MPILVRKVHNARFCFSHVRLDDGKRVLVSVGHDGIKLLRLGFGGFVPTGTIWSCSQIDMDRAVLAFADPSRPSLHPLDAVTEAVMNCRTLEELKARVVSL